MRGRHFSFHARTVIAQSLASLTAFLITHLYSPQDYGVFLSIIAASSILSSLSTLKIESGIMSSLKDEDAFLLARLALRASLWFSVFLAVFFYVCMIVGIQFGEVDRKDLWIWIPIYVMLYSFFAVLTALMTRMQLYSSIANRQLIQNTSTLTGQVMFSVLTKTSSALLVGDAIGRFLGVALLARNLAMSTFLYSAQPSLRLNSPLVRQIGIWSGVGHFIESIAIYSPLILIGYFFGNSEAGQIGFLERLVAIPVSLLGATLGRILLGQSAHAYRNEESMVYPRLRRWIRNTLLSILPLSLIFYFFGKSILMMLVSEAWHQSIYILSLSVPTIVISCLWNVISNIFISHGRFRAFFCFATTRLLTVIASFTLCLELGLGYSSCYLVTIYLVSAVELIWLFWFSKLL